MPVIVVTGASAGIGKATARRFLDEGWHVALLARRMDPLLELAQGRASALPIACDVTDEGQVDAAFAATVARFGRVDVLFNNAGKMLKGSLIDELSLADWQAMVDVNLTGMFLCARAAFRQMRRQAPMGGRIINNGSVSAHAPRPGSVAYTSTKHAITGMTKTLALDGRKATMPKTGFFVGPTIFDHATPDMSIVREEIFGPVLSVMRAKTLDDAIAMANQSEYGNMAVIFTDSGNAVRRFTRTIQAGMQGVNVGVPAPMAVFPFSGWKRSFYGDLHANGEDAVRFFTDSRVLVTRWI